MKKTSPGPASRLTRRQVLLAAKRYYDLGHTQADIAADLGVSPSYVARLMKQAKDSGWVRIFIDTDRELDLAAQIMERYTNLRHVEVVPTGATPADTALSVATAMASWFNDLIERDEENDEPKIKNVAIGGAWTHRLMVEQVISRKNRISVGPTTLTPFRGKVARWTASTVATQLAERLGALTADDLPSSENGRRGYFYNLTVDPPAQPLDSLRNWYAALSERSDYQLMLDFWRHADIVLLSVAGLEFSYGDVAKRLELLDTSIEDMKSKGAKAVLANQFIDSLGQLVPLADGVPGYEPTFPIELLKDSSSSDQASHRLVVLDARGSSVICVVPHIASITHLFLDDASATLLLSAHTDTTRL